MEYKGFYIEAFGAGFTVEYCGDEIYFDTVAAAEAFIDSIEEG